MMSIDEPIKPVLESTFALRETVGGCVERLEHDRLEHDRLAVASRDTENAREVRAAAERDMWASVDLARQLAVAAQAHGLSDSRGQQVDAASWLAEKATRQGRLDDAREQYARAAAIEQAIAFDSADAPVRVRSVLAVSAAALWFKSARWPELQIFVHGLLAEPDLLTPDARTELRALLLRSWNESTP